MNEVDEMYENAGVKPINFAKRGAIDFTNTIEIDGKRYPEFTAEKQLELIKWLAKQPLTIDNVDGEFEFLTGCKLSDFGNFEESLAEIINNLWQDLAEEECKQIKEILE